METLLKAVVVVALFFFFAGLISVASGAFTYFLWNWLVPVIFKGAVSQLTFLQAIGVNFLCVCLFKNTNINSSSRS